MPRKNTTDTATTESTATKRAPSRRTALDRRERETLAYNVLPLYMRQMGDDIKALQSALDGKNTFVTADAAKRMIAQFEMQATEAQNIINKLVGSPDSDDD